MHSLCSFPWALTEPRTVTYLGVVQLKFQDETEFAGFRASRMLPKETLHPRLADKVWSAFLRGEYDVAVLQAMKAVEVAVRDAAGFPNSVLGVNLMRTASTLRRGH